MLGLGSDFTRYSKSNSKGVLYRLVHNITALPYTKNDAASGSKLQNKTQKQMKTMKCSIDDNFFSLLHSPTLMPRVDRMPQDSETKQNCKTTSESFLQAKKSLMEEYWQVTKKTNQLSKKKYNLYEPKIKTTQCLPQLSSEGKLGAFIKAKEKQKERQGRQKKEISMLQIEPEQTVVQIINHTCVNDSKEFLVLQKYYFKGWDTIQLMLKKFEKFTEHYELSNVQIDLKKVVQLCESNNRSVRLVTHPHSFLGCFLNAQTISQNSRHKRGIRFYGQAGRIRAIIVIQASVRRYLKQKQFRVYLRKWKMAEKIQIFYKQRLVYLQTKKTIFVRQLLKIERFKQLQDNFRTNYHKNELVMPIKYEIHIASESVSEWQRVSTSSFNESQNTELSRIFNLASRKSAGEIRIIYVSSVSLPTEIVRYYKKLFQLNGAEELYDRLTILTTESSRLPSSLSLSQRIYYCSRTLKRIRSIVKNSYAYVVPSVPSNDYILLCEALSVPLYSGNPQQILYLQCKSGCKSFEKKLVQQNGFGILPSAIDIYSEGSFLKQLSQLIVVYPDVKKWVLKIDCEKNARGIAFINVGKILPHQLLLKLKSGDPECFQAIHGFFSLKFERKVECIVPFDRRVYPNQEIFMQNYYAYGGIIEEALNNLEGNLENTCFTVQIQPDGEWNFFCSYQKIVSQHKTVGCYYSSDILTPPLQINTLVQLLLEKHLFGFYTFEFIITPKRTTVTTGEVIEQRTTYLLGIQGYLGKLSAISYLRDFLARDGHVLYIPMLQHPAIKELRIQTFFHLCRLQNISFDIEKKMGNVFTFVDGLDSNCLGVLAFDPCSKEDCFTHASQVLEFLHSRLSDVVWKNVPDCFIRAKNSVNGCLKKLRKQKMLLLKSTNQQKSIFQITNNFRLTGGSQKGMTQSSKTLNGK